MSARPRSLRTIDKQILIEFYKVQWEDIRDLNNLDWRVALIFIPLVGAFSAVVGILSEWVQRVPDIPLEINDYAQTIQAFALIIFVLCVYGLWTVAKGQAHSRLKFKTLDEIEKDLEIHCYSFIRREKYRLQKIWPVIACRRIVLYVVYLLLGHLSFSMVVVPIDRWSFSASWQTLLLVPYIVAAAFAVIHYWDYRLHERSTETC